MILSAFENQAGEVLLCTPHRWPHQEENHYKYPSSACDFPAWELSTTQFVSGHPGLVTTLNPNLKFANNKPKDVVSEDFLNQNDQEGTASTNYKQLGDLNANMAKSLVILG